MEEQTLKGFAEMMKGFWNNQDLEVPNLETPCKQEPCGDTISRQAAIEAIKKSRFLVDAMEKVIKLPSAQPEAKPIEYRDCANAMLEMWMDDVVTDGEYERIMDKLNAYWRK